MHIPKTVRNTVVSFVVLLLLFAGGGVAYTYFAGQSGPVDAAAVASPDTTKDVAEPVIKPKKPAANAKESAAVESLTTPVTPGSNASILVRTLAGSSCKIVVTYNNVPSTDSGLIAKKADDFGTVSWTWTVDKSAPMGAWPVKVTCTYHSRSAVVQADLQIKKPTP